jgi:hypothetical protein
MLCHSFPIAKNSAISAIATIKEEARCAKAAQKGNASDTVLRQCFKNKNNKEMRHHRPSVAFQTSNNSLTQVRWGVRGKTALGRVAGGSAAQAAPLRRTHLEATIIINTNF